MEAKVNGLCFYFDSGLLGVLGALAANLMVQ